MNRDKLVGEIAKLIEVEIDALNESFNLKRHGIDSLAIISMIAIIDINCGVRVQGCEIESCETVNDIFNLVELKRK